MHNGDAPAADHGADSHDHAGGRPPRSFKERFIIPLSIPIGAAIVIAAIIASISQILLTLPGPASTSVAMLIALVILLGASFLATAPHLRRQTLMASIAVPLVALFIAGGSTAAYRKTHPEEKKSAQTAAAPAPEVTTDNKFSVTSYTIQAGQPTTITVTNNGAAQHNMHILGVQDPSGQDIKTDLLAPGSSAKLTFTINDAGTYKFHCDVHPTEMTGTITVQPSNTSATAATAASGPGAAGGINEVATDNKFSQTSLSVDHGVQTSLVLQNNGTAIHNWHLLGVTGPDGKDIKTDPVESKKSAQISFQIDKPGSYKFQCDFHPTEMLGTLTVK